MKTVDKIKNFKNGDFNNKLDILVVEDNPANQETAILTLDKYANRLSIVGDFEGAYSALENNSYDVVMTDNFMPLGTKNVYGPLRKEKKEREEVRAYAFAVTMLALKYDISRVVIVSHDTDHHAGPDQYIMADIFKKKARINDKIIIYPGYSLLEFEKNSDIKLLIRHCSNNFYYARNGNYLIPELDFYNALSCVLNPLEKKYNRYRDDLPKNIKKYFNRINAIEYIKRRKDWGNALKKLF